METRLRLRRRLLRIDDSYLGDESENNDEDNDHDHDHDHDDQHHQLPIDHTFRTRERVTKLEQSFDQLELRATTSTSTANNRIIATSIRGGVSSSRYLLKRMGKSADQPALDEQPDGDDEEYDHEAEDQEDDVDDNDEDDNDDNDDAVEDQSFLENNGDGASHPNDPSASNTSLPAIRKAEKCATSHAIKLLYSRVDASRPPVVCFEYPSNLEESREYPVNARFQVVHRQHHALFYKTHWERNCVKNAFAVAGFQRTKTKWRVWHVAWAKHMPRAQFKKLESHQIFNHFPDPWIIGRKDRLMKTLMTAKRRFGHASYGFFPEGFTLPSQTDALRRALHSTSCSGNGKHMVWIVKPPASACGRGIRVVSSKEVEQMIATKGKKAKKKKTLVPSASTAAGAMSSASSLKTTNKKHWVVQKYIANPFLVDGYKFDLRLYVLVTSVDPLRIYLFREGLVRFCTSKFNLETLKNRFSHLTNYAVNKKNSTFQENTTVEAQNVGSKWSWTALCRHFFQPQDPPQRESPSSSKELQKVEQQIHEVVCKTIIAGESHWVSLTNQFVKPKQKCFELFGFDLMLDQTGKVWLIEVNVSPSLMGGSPLDRRVKGLLLSDIFHLVGIPVKCKDAAPGPGLSPDPPLSPPPPAPAMESNRCSMRRTRACMERPSSSKSSCSTSSSSSGHQQIGPGSTSISMARSHTRQLHDVVMDPVITSFEKHHVELFGSHEWDLIVQLEDEHDRLGHFERVFPSANFDQTMHLTGFFNSPRYANNLCAKWLNTRPKVRADALLLLGSRRR